MRRIWLIGFIGLLACSSAPRKGDVEEGDALNDVLVSFTINAQANRWSEALELMTYEEQLRVLDANGDIKPEYKVAMKRMKLSTLQKAGLELDSKGRLIGMVAVLEESNRRAVVSDEQRSLDLSKIEKDRFAPNNTETSQENPDSIQSGTDQTESAETNELEPAAEESGSTQPSSSGE